MSIKKSIKHRAKRKLLFEKILFKGPPLYLLNGDGWEFNVSPNLLRNKDDNIHKCKLTTHLIFTNFERKFRTNLFQNYFNTGCLTWTYLHFMT